MTASRSRRISAASLLAIVVLAALPTRARADAGDDAARATKLFEEGRALAKDGRCAEAIPLFLESVQRATGVGALLNLGNCYELQGKTASAYDHFRRAADVARSRQDRREQEALDRATALEPRLSTLAIRTGGMDEPDLEVRLDDTVIGSAQRASPLRVDPGSHVVRASSSRRNEVVIRVMIAGDGERAEIVIPQPAVLLPTPAAPERASTTLRTAGWIAGATGATMLVAGSILGALSAADHGELVDQCPLYPTCAAPRRAELDALNASASRKGDVATVMFVGGAALVVTGVVLILTAPRANPGRTTDASR